MAHSTYNKGVFERTWKCEENEKGKTALVGWYHVPEGFKLSEIEMDFSIVSSTTRVKDDTTDPDIQLHNIGYYALYGLWFQMPSDGEVDFSTAANLEARVMELLPSTSALYHYQWNSSNSNAHSLVDLDVHVESHAEMTNPFLYGTNGIGVHGTIVTAQEHSTGAGAVKPHIWLTEDHQKVGALFGKGYVVAEDKQRFVDRKHYKFKKNLYAHHGRGDGMLAIIMSTPDVRDVDAWSSDAGTAAKAYRSTVMYDPNNNERNTWIRSYDPEGVYEQLNMSKQVTSGNTTGEPERTQIFGQLTNPFIRSSETSGLVQAVNPTSWTTYTHFEKLHVRPISKKDDAKRNLHINTV